MIEFVVTVNAPGEVAGWLLPLAEQVKAKDSRATIRAVLTPCPFAGGRERAILSSHGALDEVADLGPFVRRLIRDRLAGRRRTHRTIVLHLGGDRLYSLLLARLLGAPAWVYGTSRHWSRRYDRCLVPDARTTRKLLASGVSPARIAEVGEMVVDSVPAAIDQEIVRTLGLDPDREEIVALMAGSRLYEVNFMLPFYAGLIDVLAARRPSVRCLLPFSEFVEPDVLAQAMARAGLTAEPAAHGLRVRTRNGATAHVVTDDRYGAMTASSMVVTLPGTNTLQLAAMGVPMLVVIPLNEIENVVVEGPINWLSTRWRATRALKRFLLLRLSAHLGRIALPNILSGRELVPELRAMLTPEDVATQLERWLDDAEGRRGMSRDLRAIAGPRGAAARLAAELLQGEDASCACGS